MKLPSTISIVGCGWLGLPLGAFFVRQGVVVKGSTTSPEKFSKLQSVGIAPFLLKLTPEVEGEAIHDLLQSEALIINIPPGRGREDVDSFHTTQINRLLPFIIDSPVKKVIYASSTSVYREMNRVVHEDDMEMPDTLLGKSLLHAENLLKKRTEFKSTILRFSGLAGYNRKQGLFLVGKIGSVEGSTPVNMVHRDDGIEIIHQVIRQGKWGYTFNICSDRHPTREEFFFCHCRKAGVEPPEFVYDAGAKYKIISNELVKRELGYSFTYPDPMQFP